MMKKFTLPLIAALLIPGQLYAEDGATNTKRDCNTFNDSNKCDVCSDGGYVVIGNPKSFGPFLNFSAGTSDAAYFDDENKIVYEFKTLTPKITTWSVSKDLLEYPSEFIWNTYEGRTVHLFRKGTTERILQTKINKGIRLTEIHKDLTDDYDLRFKFITKYRKVKGENKLSKKRKLRTCTFFKAATAE